MEEIYSPPVAKLLQLGRPEGRTPEQWPDYAAMGIGPEHVSELIRLIRDWRRYWDVADESEESADGSEETSTQSISQTAWARSIHAWHALGRLRATESMNDLLDVTVERDLAGDDWFLEGLPEVFGLLGEPAIDPLAKFVLDATKPEFSRRAAGHGLERIASRSPACRERVVAVLAAVLDITEGYDAGVNGSFVAYLADLKAVEAAPAMRRAFAPIALTKTCAVTGPTFDQNWDSSLRPAAGWQRARASARREKTAQSKRNPDATNSATNGKRKEKPSGEADSQLC